VARRNNNDGGERISQDEVDVSWAPYWPYHVTWEVNGRIEGRE
jgi:hypothetical protein